MRCCSIICQPLPSPLLGEHKDKQVIWVPKSRPFTFQVNWNRSSIVTKSALHSHHILLAASLPPPAPKLSVLLLTSLAFALVYWVANFVVPEIVLKDIQSNSKSSDEDGENLEGR